MAGEGLLSSWPFDVLSLILISSVSVSEAAWEVLLVPVTSISIDSSKLKLRILKYRRTALDSTSYPSGTTW